MESKLYNAHPVTIHDLTISEWSGNDIGGRTWVYATVTIGDDLGTMMVTLRVGAELPNEAIEQAIIEAAWEMI